MNQIEEADKFLHIYMESEWDQCRFGIDSIPNVCREGRAVDALIEKGGTDDGVSLYSSSKKCGAPIYRLYNPNCQGAGSHYYTADEAERDHLVRLGWKDEGVGWYRYSLIKPNETEHPLRLLSEE